MLVLLFILLGLLCFGLLRPNMVGRRKAAKAFEM